MHPRPLPSIPAALALALAVTSVSFAAPPPEYTGKPFTDSYHKSGPPVIPGIVQCALYDLGGEGVAYHDTDTLNNGSGKLNLEPGHQRAHASAALAP